MRELSLSQGVVEKKTTIPILSNVLIEADGDRITLDRYRSGVGHPLLLSGQGQKRRIGHGSGAEAAWIMCGCCRKAIVNIKFLENHWASITCGRSRTRIAGMSRESFPELPQMPAAIAEIPVKTAGFHDLAHAVRHLHGGIAVHAEWRAAADAGRKRLTMVATDGHRLAYVRDYGCR